MAKSIKSEILEIADYMYANPDKKFVGIVSYFVGKMQKSDRTIQRYVVEAQKIVGERQKIAQQAKEAAIAESAKKEIKKGIISRMEAKEILSNIAKGNPRSIRIKGETVKIYPKDKERISAIKELSEIEGWKAAIKTENKIVYPTKINIIKDNYRNG